MPIRDSDAPRDVMAGLRAAGVSIDGLANRMLPQIEKVCSDSRWQPTITRPSDGNRSSTTVSRATPT